MEWGGEEGGVAHVRRREDHSQGRAINLLETGVRLMLEAVPKRLSKGSAYHENGGAHCGGAYWNRSVY